MSSSPEINIPAVVAEVQAAFDRYDQGLEDNDVPVLDDSFWNHALTQRFGVAENLYGHGQAWVRFPEGWKVVAAHVSMMPEAS